MLDPKDRQGSLVLSGGLARQGSLKLVPVNGTIRVTQSNLEAEFAKRPELQQYAERLMAMDTDHNGEIGLDEVCEMLKEVAEVEKERRVLKWFVIIMAVLNLLTVAATVGLTYAVVVLSKDTSVDSNVLVEKSSGTPMMVGTPEFALIYNEADAASLLELFDNSTVIDFTGSRRRLLAADDWCSSPKLDALALTSYDFVKNRCTHITKAGNSATFQMKVQRNTRSADCNSVEGRSSKTKACATYRDAVQVTDDDCNLVTKTLPCRAVGQKYRVGIIWGDSVMFTRKHTSYYFSCVGTCTAGKDGASPYIKFGNCGVARSQCPLSSVTPTAGRRLQGVEGEEDFSGMTLNVHGHKMDCSSGVCLA